MRSNDLITKIMQTDKHLTIPNKPGYEEHFCAPLSICIMKNRVTDPSDMIELFDRNATLW